MKIPDVLVSDVGASVITVELETLLELLSDELSVELSDELSVELSEEVPVAHGSSIAIVLVVLVLVVVVVVTHGSVMGGTVV